MEWLVSTKHKKSPIGKNFVPHGISISKLRSIKVVFHERWSQSWSKIRSIECYYVMKTALDSTYDPGFTQSWNWVLENLMWSLKSAEILIFCWKVLLFLASLWNILEFCSTWNLVSWKVFISCRRKNICLSLDNLKVSYTDNPCCVLCKD